jgi:signal transduction histidine kinase
LRHTLYELGRREWDIPALRRSLEDLLLHNAEFNDLEVEQTIPGLGPRVLLLFALRIYRQGTGEPLVILAIEDVTERRELEERKRLEEMILEVTEKERRRIGRDLHDTLGQQLSALMFVLDEIEGQLSARSLPEAKGIAEASTLLESAIAQTRALARGLSPPITADSCGLVEAIRQFAEDIRAHYGIDCRFECDTTLRVRGDSAGVHLYRIVQEAVSNAIRHGKANHIVIGLEHQNDHVELVVRDDGIGIHGHTEDSQGMGLDVMNYRASIVGGRLDVSQGGEGGTIVACEFPTDLVIGQEGGDHGD